MKRTFFTVILLTSIIFALPAQEYYGRWLGGTVSFPASQTDRDSQLPQLCPKLDFIYLIPGRPG
jgi:hypothetical protein